ncbi:MAG: hypothetical protein WBP56_06650 [Polyangia bacterium]
MKIRDEIARKHWEQAAIEEASRYYLENGYQVQTQASVGEHEADLVAKRGEEIIVSEFKSGPWPPAKEKAALDLRKYVIHKMKGKFLLVWTPPPVETSIEVEGLEDELRDYLLNDLPSDLDSLSTHTRIEAVSHLFISSVHLRHDSSEIHGNALVEVELQYGSDGDVDRDRGDVSGDSFPFDFIVELDKELSITRVDKLEIDTSSFYEE